MDMISLEATLSNGGPLEIRTPDDLVVLSQAVGDGMDPSRLRMLSLTSHEFSDITVLRRLTGLKALSLLYTSVSDLSPIAQCTELEILELKSIQTADLDFLPSLKKLKTLSLGWDQIFMLGIEKIERH